MSRTVTLYAPFDEYCGYGARARDLANCTKYIKNYNFEFTNLKFGSSPIGFLKDQNEEYILSKLTENEDTDISVLINVPAPDQNFGKKNILITAGVETDILPKQYVEYSKEKDLILTSSKFAQQTIQEFVPDVPCKVLFEAYDPVYLEDAEKCSLVDELSCIKESFIFYVWAIGYREI